MQQARRMFRAGEQPTIGELAGAAQVSRTTFYRHFPSRPALLEALDLAPEPETRDRILEAALDLLQQRTLSALSMDDLAINAGVSRANLYRLFPGKTALFRALLLAYSPFQSVMELLTAQADEPPGVLIPRIVRTAYRTVHSRRGVVRTLILEVSSTDPDARPAFAETGMIAFATLARYLQAQMDAGRLRRMHPFLALQALVGPVLLHFLATPLFPAEMSEATGDEAVAELARHWLRAMEPGR
jgi:TetR/AcrR family transcriptional regulator